MKYILNFNDHSQFINKEEPYNNLVSLCKLQDHIHYGQDNDKYKNECFSIKLLSGSNATIQIKYDPSITSNSMWISTVPVRCNEETNEIYMSDAAGHDTQIAGQVVNNVGLFEINNLNEGDQIWICTIDETNPWTETDANSNTIQHGALEFNILNCTVSLQGNIMSLFTVDETDFMYDPNNNRFTNSRYNYMCCKMFMFGNVSKTILGNTYTGNEVIVYAHNLILPLKALPEYSYINMFTGCFSLKTIPQLPATTIGRDSYNAMFNNCMSLEDISYLNLPYMSVPMNGWRNMFNRCISLKKVMSKLSFTQSYSGSTGYYNCAYMFYQCTSLEKAPKLYINQTGAYGLAGMFYQCTSLIEASTFEVTGLFRHHVCDAMFSGCTKLVNIFENLRCVWVNQHHFNNMFCNCKSLLRTPKLSAKDNSNGTEGKLSYANFYYMFDGCNKLNYIDVSGITDRSATYATTNWVRNVAATGTFVTNNKSIWGTGATGIPSGWTVIDSNGNIL